MRVRMRFAKQGPMKFIGHLDVMRYFQKALRRAKLDVAYTEGFSPHIILSFANPLGVGLTSEGEYFDIVLNTPMSSAAMVEAMNQQMAEGFRILSAVEIPDIKSLNAMAIVQAAAYEVSFRHPEALPADWQQAFAAFMARTSLPVTKRTKKGQRELDIRPLIFEWDFQGENTIRMLLSSGSQDNLRPELVIQAFGDAYGLELPFEALQIHRKELYAYGRDNCLIPLEQLGQIIE